MDVMVVLSDLNGWFLHRLFEFGDLKNAIDSTLNGVLGFLGNFLLRIVF